MKTHFLFILASLLLASGSALAQDVVVQADRDSVMIGEPFTVTLSATARDGETVVFPEPPVAAGELELLSVIRRTDAESPGVPSIITYQAVTFALDSLYAQVPVILAAGADSTQVLSSPLLLGIISTVPEGAEGIRDLMPLADFPTAWLDWLTWILGLALGLLLAWYLYRRYFKKEPEQVVVRTKKQESPYEKALKRLGQLESADPGSADTVYAYFVDLSETLRTYVEEATGVQALEHTTSELLHLIKQPQIARLFEDGIAERLNAVLSLADLAKFADYKPPASSGKNALDNSRYIVETLHERLTPATPVTTDHSVLSEPLEVPS